MTTRRDAAFWVAHASRVLATRVLAVANFPHSVDCPLRMGLLEKFVTARRRDQHARRVRYPGDDAGQNRPEPFNDLTYAKQ
ncbi:hypothetical protein BH20VER3_BH20VER3_18150 [soil metagenome]